MEQSHDFFGQIASRYDAFAERAAPHGDEMRAELLRCLPDTAKSVLELGCGTGRLLALLAAKYPQASITAVDAASEMIDVARARLDGTVDPAKIELIISRFEDWSAPDATFDVVVSMFSLHHIVDKEPFYAKLRKMIVRGGFFALGDEHVAEPSRIGRLHRADWLEFARAPGHLTDDELADILRHDSEFDHYETLRAQMRMLQSAGFDPLDCVWRWRNYAVVVAEANPPKRLPKESHYAKRTHPTPD
jgi:ubiquinone/menaquinone biosynthesis C-methylase UbiE